MTPIPVDRLLEGSGGNGEAPVAPDPAHTVNVLSADCAGNVVSMTATQGGLYGSTVVIDGLGLVMGHGMSRFDLVDGSPNAPAAGKRRFTTGRRQSSWAPMGARVRPWDCPAGARS